MNFLSSTFTERASRSMKSPPAIIALACSSAAGVRRNCPESAPAILHAEKVGYIVIGAGIQRFHFRSILSATDNTIIGTCDILPHLPAQPHAIQNSDSQVRDQHVRRPVLHQLQPISPSLATRIHNPGESVVRKTRVICASSSTTRIRRCSFAISLTAFPGSDEWTSNRG